MPASLRTPSLEGFANIADPSVDAQATYRGKAGDYDAYCRSHGICPPVEGFLGATCSSVKSQAPPQPMFSPEVRQQLDRAFQTHLASDPPKAAPAQGMPQRKVDMSKVGGFVDEEIEAYMTVNDLHATRVGGANNMVGERRDGAGASRQDVAWEDGTTSRKETAVHPSLSPSPSQLGGRSSTPSGALERDLNRWQNMMDLMLFVFAGILLIFLCEQLFKLAALHGMNRTLATLDPMFQMLQDHLKEKMKA